MPNTANFFAETQGAQVNGTVTDKQIVLPDVPPTGRTAIGPRVTFNFIRDAWNSNNSYSYYDVVQVSGNSYIARQNVPAGIEITDTDYWVHWAEPNAQYQELYNIVMTYQAAIDKLQSDVQSMQDALEKLVSADTYAMLAEKGFVYKEV